MMALSRAGPPAWDCSRNPTTPARQVSTTLVVNSSLARHAMKPTVNPAARQNPPISVSARRNGVDSRSLVRAVTDHVSRSAHRMQQRLGEALVDLAPQSRNVHIDNVGLRIEVIVPDVLEQHGARDNLTGMLHQVFEQAKFARLQHDRLAAARDLVR